MQRYLTTPVCLALLAVALLCIVASVTATPAGETYPFVRNAAYPNGTPWDVGPANGIAINATGYVFISETHPPRVRVFDPAGNEVSRWQDPEAWDLWGIAVSSQYVYVTDVATNCVHVYSLSGTPLGAITLPGGARPLHVAVNSTGYAFVSCSSGSVCVITPGDTTATEFVLGLNSPNALAVNRTGYLYVSQRASTIVNIFDRDGNPVPGISTSSPVFDGMTFDASDRLFIAEHTEAGLFDGYSLAGSYLGTSQAGFLNYPSGITVTASGEAYVLNRDGGNVRIFRVGVPPTPTPSGSGSFAAYPESGPAPHQVRFLDYTANGRTWSWDFGDGGSSDQQYPLHVYNRSGLYTVSVTVTDWAGVTSTKTEYHLIRVGDPVTPAPTAVAIFSANATVGSAPMAVAFTDASGPAPYHRWWTFGDGSSSTDANPVHTYTKAGTYTVNLTAWTAIGMASTTGTITVGADPRAPVANFTMSRSSGPAPLYVKFTDASTGSPTSWRWGFGGLAWTTTTNLNVIFRQPGDYVITLVATNAYGSSTAIRNLSVTGAMPRSVRESSVSVVG